MIKIMDDELRNFSILVEAPKTPFGKGVLVPYLHHRHASADSAIACFFSVKKTYSGKVGGRNDDVHLQTSNPDTNPDSNPNSNLNQVVITMQLAITGVRTFYQSDKYQNFRPTM